MNSEILNIPDIHVGNMILDYLKSHDRTQSYLARILEMNVANLNKILKKKSMETERLFEISMKLDYNFFAVFGNDLNLTDSGTYKITMPELGLQVWLMTSDEGLKIGTPHELAASGDLGRFVERSKDISFDTDKLRVISDALNYNFFKDFYSAKDDPMAEQQNEQSNMGMILRLEELAGENRLQKQEIENLKKENLYLKTKLTEAGIEF